jgi:hypothetical protein
MRIRTADVEQSLRAPGVTSKLSVAASPLGGDFGTVRSHNRKNHQGWDLYAAVWTPTYAISPGTVVFVAYHGDYGQQLCLRLQGREIEPLARRLGAAHLYAFYGHLLSVFVDNGCEVKEGYRLGLTGNSGNAHNTPPHLHFEIRRHAHLGKGLHGRINPGEVLGFQYYQCFPWTFGHMRLSICRAAKDLPRTTDLNKVSGYSNTRSGSSCRSATTSATQYSAASSAPAWPAHGSKEPQPSALPKRRHSPE